MHLRRALLPAFAALLTTFLVATPALAHTSLKSSTPAAGASLATAPGAITLTFGEAVTLPADPIRVTGPDGAAWTVGRATVTDATVTAPVTATGPAGAYTLSWRVISDDGDTVKGVVRFTMTVATSPAATPTPTAPAATSSAVAVVPVSLPPSVPAPDGGVPAWVWVLGALVVAAAAAGLVIRTKRS